MLEESLVEGANSGYHKVFEKVTACNCVICSSKQYFAIQILNVAIIKTI